MNQPKTLVIVAADFPHGYGEPYLEGELQVLSHYFESIFIVIPESHRVNKSQVLFQLPANTSIIYLENEVTPRHKLGAATKIFTRRAVNHLKTVVSLYRLRLSAHIIKSMLAYEASDLAFRKMLIQVLREKKVAFHNLYVYSYWLTNYTFSLARIKKEFPFVKAFTRAHGWDVYFERHQPPYLPYRDFILPQLDKVFPISENGREYLLAKVPGLPTDKLITARLGTDEQQFISYQIGNGRLRLLTLTFIMLVKHLELLVEVLATSALPIDWHHIGGGESDYASNFLKSAKMQLESRANIRFVYHGTLDKKQIEDFFASTAIDLIVNTSYSEGIPVSIMQAMSFGIPAIAPRVGGIPEMIDNGTNGFLMSAAPAASELNGLLEKYYHLGDAAKEQLRRNAYAIWKEKFHNRKNYQKFADEIMKMTSPQYQVCSRCVLDSNDSTVITFDEEGVCSLCRIYDDAVKKSVFRGKEGEEKLNALVQEVKKAGAKNQYDCIIGLSGGVDSTYVAWKVKEMGLRPLAVHLDNGWDSELAVKNIENIVRKLGIDLHTHVINWNEFRDLQLSYFKAGVIDLEIPTDHAIMAVLHHEARKNSVKYILSGHNLVTEGFLPDDWIHHKFDVRNLKAIHKQFGSEKLKTYPLLPFFEKLFYEKVLRVQQISVLNFLPYEKNEAKRLIMEKLSWRDYGGKHYESIFTRFYQAYILPRKFGVDKRKSHLSTLICSGQLTREAVLEMLEQDPYPTEEMRNADRTYVIKKLGFTEAEFEAYMKAPARSHNDYPSYMNIYFKLRPLIRIYRKVFPRK